MPTKEELESRLQALINEIRASPLLDKELVKEDLIQVEAINLIYEYLEEFEKNLKAHADVLSQHQTDYDSPAAFILKNVARAKVQPIPETQLPIYRSISNLRKALLKPAPQATTLSDMPLPEIALPEIPPPDILHDLKNELHTFIRDEETQSDFYKNIFLKNKQNDLVKLAKKLQNLLKENSNAYETLLMIQWAIQSAQEHNSGSKSRTLINIFKNMERKLLNSTQLSTEEKNFIHLISYIDRATEKLDKQASFPLFRKKELKQLELATELHNIMQPHSELSKEDKRSKLTALIKENNTLFKYSFYPTQKKDALTGLLAAFEKELQSSTTEEVKKEPKI